MWWNRLQHKLSGGWRLWEWVLGDCTTFLLLSQVYSFRLHLQFKKSREQPVSSDSCVCAANTCCDSDLITHKNFIEPDGCNFYCFYCYSNWVVFKTSTAAEGFHPWWEILVNLQKCCTFLDCTPGRLHDVYMMCSLETKWFPLLCRRSGTSAGSFLQAYCYNKRKGYN